MSFVHVIILLAAIVVVILLVLVVGRIGARWRAEMADAELNAKKLADDLKSHVAKFKDGTYGVRRYNLVIQSWEFLVESPKFTVYAWTQRHTESTKYNSTDTALAAIERSRLYYERINDKGERADVPNT